MKHHHSQKRPFLEYPIPASKIGLARRPPDARSWSSLRQAQQDQRAGPGSDTGQGVESQRVADADDKETSHYIAGRATNALQGADDAAGGVIAASASSAAFSVAARVIYRFFS
jgi:hypothetical protein